jgi:hypothetical protein
MLVGEMAPFLSRPSFAAFSGVAGLSPVTTASMLPALATPA